MRAIPTLCALPMAIAAGRTRTLNGLSTHRFNVSETGRSEDCFGPCRHRLPTGAIRKLYICMYVRSREPGCAPLSKTNNGRLDDCVYSPSRSALCSLSESTRGVTAGIPSTNSGFGLCAPRRRPMRRKTMIFKIVASDCDDSDFGGGGLTAKRAWTRLVGPRTSVLLRSMNALWMLTNGAPVVVRVFASGVLQQPQYHLSMPLSLSRRQRRFSNPAVNLSWEGVVTNSSLPPNSSRISARPIARMNARQSLQ
jgi:hypothetical protein